MHLSTSRTSFASLCFVSRRSLSLILSMRAFFKLIYLASNSLLLHSNWAISALFLSISFLNERFSFSTLHKETAIVWVCLRKYVTVFCPLPSFVYQNVYTNILYWLENQKYLLWILLKFVRFRGCQIFANGFFYQIILFTFVVALRWH